MAESEKYIEYLKLSVKLIDFQTKIRDLKKEINKLNDTFEDRNKTEEWYKKNLESLKKEVKEMNDKVSSFTDEEKKEFSERTKIKIYEAEIVDVKGELKKVATDGKTFLHIGLNDQYSIKINSLQIAGKKRLKTEDLLRGFKINNQWSIR